MEKTEMMIKFEQETGKQSAIVKFSVGGQALEVKSYPKLGLYDYNTEYLAWLEAKAAAYDRLMSGALSMKELANILKHPVATDAENRLLWFPKKPKIGVGTWIWYDNQFGCFGEELPDGLINFSGNWEDSLTMPDTLEVSNGKK